MAAQPHPQTNESFEGRQRLFKNVWKGFTSSTSTKKTKPVKLRKIIRTARMDGDKQPIILHKYLRKVRAKKMVKVCNKILNYCEEHGLAKHILAQRAELAFRKSRKKRRRIPVKRSPKRSSSLRSIEVARASNRKSVSPPRSPRRTQKKKLRPKKKSAHLRKKRSKQTSATVKSWINVELLKQSLNDEDRPNGEAKLLIRKKPNTKTDVKLELHKKVPKKSESAKECPKELTSSLESLKRSHSTKAFQERKTRCPTLNSLGSKIESIKEVATPVESVDTSIVLTRKLHNAKAIPKSAESPRKSNSKAREAKKTCSDMTTTESMDSVQKKVTDYISYQKAISSRVETDPVESFKEVMRVLESRRARVISKDPASNASKDTVSNTSAPKSYASKRKSSKGHAADLVTHTTVGLGTNSGITVMSVQSTKSPTTLNPKEIRRIVRRIKSASYPNTPTCLPPVPGTSWRSCYSAASRMAPYANRKLLPVNKVSIE